jgi:hypothetical protein
MPEVLKILKLYHGSNLEVRNPKLLPNVRALDFGAGFYLTSNLEQASRWSRLTVKRRQSGEPIITAFEVNKERMMNLSVLTFEHADAAWLKFISANRREENMDMNWDVVVGPVANDNTMPVLNLYFKGSYDEQETLKRLLPQKLKDQYAFKTPGAIALLAWKEAIVL